MIDKKFWEKVAGEWKKADDGIDIPSIVVDPVVDWGDDEIPFDEIDDILSDLGLDI